MRGRRTEFPVFCVCREPIEHCDGALGDWMHTVTRSERCADGDVARPQGPNEVAARFCVGRRRKAGVR
jgi:hypothetical protein